MIFYLFLFLVSISIRLVNLDQSLWLDEGASVMFARLPFSQFFNSLKGDFHPPTYYLILRFVRSIFGDNIINYRLFSVVVGSLTVVFFASLLKSIFLNTSLGRGRFRLPLYFAGGLLMALNPLHVYYSQEVRMYALSALLSVVSWRLLIKPSNLKLFANFVVNLISVFTFYPLIFNLVAQLLYLIFVDRRNLSKFLWYQTLIGLAFLFWSPVLISQLKGGGYITSSLRGWSSLSGIVSFKSLALIFIKFHIGRITLYPKMFYALIAVILILFQASVLFLSIRRPSLSLWFFLIIPLILGLLISIKSPMMGYWRFVFVLPALLGLIVYGLELMPFDLGVVNLAFILMVYVFSLFTYFTNQNFQREDWRGLSASLPERGTLLVSFPEAFAPLKYYLPQNSVIPLQSKVGKNRDDWDVYLPSVLKNSSTIWVSEYLMELTDPNKDILSWMVKHNYSLLGQKNFHGVGIVYKYQKP